MQFLCLFPCSTIPKIIITDEKLSDEDRGHLCQGQETKVDKKISGQVLNIKGSRYVEIIIDNPDHRHVEYYPKH